MNCGGHAFATEGYLLGPILEEFRLRRQELIDALFVTYNAALERKGKAQPKKAPVLTYTVQGGIGTFEEAELLRHYYGMESTGWGTPFLLVPEATTVDSNTLQLLCEAGENDVVLSNNSPLGVRFHYLKGTTAEKLKAARMEKGIPGSPCTEKHLAFNIEFTTEPICTASLKYQKLKIEQLKALNLPKEEYNRELQNVLDKECLCVGLSNAAAIHYDQPFLPHRNEVNICPGPNLAHFSKVVSLQTMTDHIYGRTNIITNENRPHMFIAELYLYINYLKAELEADAHSGLLQKKEKYYSSFCKNLSEGIQYYQNLSLGSDAKKVPFSEALDAAAKVLSELNFRYELLASMIGKAHLQ